MTDNEIIKALECCEHKNYYTHCKKCVFCGSTACSSLLILNAIELINRQKSEIARLEHLADILTEPYGKIKAEAIKEFAARLRYVSKWSQSDAFSDRLVTVRDINDLEKEMECEE